MKKLAMAIVATIAFCLPAFAQDFSFDELTRLRCENISAFETAVHAKGYEMDHISCGVGCGVFTRKSNAIALCRTLNKGMSNHYNPSIKYRTTSKEDYEKIKAQVEASTKYLKTKTQEYSRRPYMKHVYSNSDVVVYMYNVAGGYCTRPYYVVEVYSIYSGY